MRFWTGDEIKTLPKDCIFVFGSNPEGRHGAGAAKAALKFGAKYGVGRGLIGQTYALPTKNLRAGFTEIVGTKTIVYDRQGYRSLSVEQITSNILEFYECAENNPDLKFIVVYKNCGKNLNGYSSEEMFQMFTSATVPKNVYFHESFKIIAKEER